MRLNAEQRRQALVWRSVMAFPLSVIANHYGITRDDVTAELLLARQEREADGKSPEPVPVVPPAGEPRPTNAEIQIRQTEALQAILEALNNRWTERARQIAINALKMTGILL